MTVNYDDGDRERLNLSDEIWHFEHSTMSASTSQSVNNQSGVPRVVDAEPDDLNLMEEHFGNKSFMKHQAQGFEQYTLNKSYDAEETSFLNTVKIVPHSDVPSDANIVNSHVLYKVKNNDDGSLKLKARIAPHCNEDDLKDFLTSD